ncbi:MAG: amino acid adenylation domain-containing protein, partial [Ferruginibacter sp.]
MLEPKWQVWKDIAAKQNILDQLGNGDSLVALKDVPNPKLLQEKLLAQGLRDKTAGTVGELLNIITKEDKEAAEIMQIIQVAGEAGYHTSLFPDEDTFRMNVLFERQFSGKLVKQVYSENGFSNNGLFTNIPLFSDIAISMQTDIRQLLQKSLPDYMMPSECIAISKLPLTNNGKIDRKFLSEREVREDLNKINYQAPRTDLEQTLVNIWQDLLGVERIGIQDNFFELGGHSLLATRTVSAVRKILNIELFIKDLFVHPTIAHLAKYLGTQSKGLLLPAMEALPRPPFIPLSFSQERLWFIDRLEGSVLYHIPAVLRLKGKLNQDALLFSLKSITNRHEVLRTVILENDGEAYQHIMPQDGLQISIIDGSAFEEHPEALQKNIEKLINDPFDLSKDHMLRATLITINEQEHVLVVTMHHIASDGWSISIIVKEVVELYSSFDEGRPATLVPLAIQYADFSIWQRNYLKDEVLDRRIAYWKEKLLGVAPLQLPLDFSRPPIQSIKGASSDFTIDKDLSAALVLLSQQQGVTLFMTLLAAFKVLMHRYTGQQDICVGTPIAGRQQQEVEDLIGFFVNTLALRSEVHSADSFTSLLQQVKKTTLEAYAHQELPFEKVVEVVVKERDLGRSPLFQVMFIFQNTPDIPTLRFGEMQLVRESSGHNTSKFELTFNITGDIRGFQVSVGYCTDLFRQQTISRMMIHFKELLHSIVKSPAQQIGLLHMLCNSDEHQLLVDFNNTQRAFPDEDSVISLFEKQAAKTPLATALVFEGEKLSYERLNELSNQLAHYLSFLGVKEQTLVPICIERGVGMIVGILGILKAGCAYVPIDPEYPVDRIQYMLEDCGANLVVCSKEGRLKLPVSGSFDVVELEGNGDAIKEQPVSNQSIKIAPQQLAYVIYTSGSTGKPKGVMIEHASVVNLLTSICDEVDFTAGSAFLSVTTFSFDICYLEFFVPLICGGKLIVVPREVAMDGIKLVKRLSDHLPTHMQGTPSTWQLLLDSEWENPEGIKILIGGEAVKENLKDALTQRGSVYNLYGPTETTIWSAIKKLETNEKVLIGQPLANTSIYIVNDQQQLCIPGVMGEICIGGIGLARGYINLPSLTAEKFIADPFEQHAGSRLYRTGDLGRWLSDGNIECIGRKDDQVKIRGYRIELGEIETILLQNSMVKEAVVVAKEDKEGNKRLVGYVVAEEDFDRTAIIAYLENKLPVYMVPRLWVELASLPLTANGKVDKKALPEVEATEQLSHEYIAPRTSTESKLAGIWQALLHVAQVGIRDNFFELGGHSLLAMRVVSAIRRELETEIAIKAVFLYPTVEGLASHLLTVGGAQVLPSIAVQVRPDHIPLSFSQERLWFIDRLEGSTQYHLPAVLRLKGELNREALAQALEKIVDRHEALRTVFLEEEGAAYQYIKEGEGWDLSIIDGSVYREDQQGLQQYVKSLISAPFDLSEDYMVRASLISVAAQEHVLVVTMHHIASDGWSTSVIVKEFAALYDASCNNRPASLSPLKVQYADYAIWQRNYLQGEVLDRKIVYWKNKLEGVSPLQLPTDYPRPAVQSTKGATVNFRIEKLLSEQLQLLSKHEGTTL